jgi:bifunctional DNase/RNase
MPTATDVGFIEMRIAKVVAFGPPLAEERFRCVVLDEVSGDRHLVIQIGETEAFWLGATLQDMRFGRPMTYQFAAALVRGLGGQVRQVRISQIQVQLHLPHINPGFSAGPVAAWRACNRKCS